MFFNPRKNKYKWASIVLPGVQPDMHYDEKVLEEATDAYIKQHESTFYECVHIVQTTMNADIRKEQFRLATMHCGSLTKVYRYATEEQKAVIERATDTYFEIEAKGKHPEKQFDTAAPIAKAKRKAKKDAFWEVYGEAEALDIFSGKKK